MQKDSACDSSQSPNERKRTSALAKASPGLAVTGIVMHLMQFPTVLKVPIFTLAATLGIIASITLMKRRKTMHGLREAILGVAISALALSCYAWSHHRMALYRAIEKGHVEKIKELVRKGYDVNTASGGGQNMLTLSFWYGSRRISPFKDTRAISKMTPDQVEAKIFEMLKILIDSGADINALDPQGRAPIHLACRRNQKRIVEMLIKEGADVNLKDRFGDTPLNFAAGHPGGSDIIELLIRSGADVNVKGSNGDTPLHDSVYSGAPKVTETLIRNGADVDARNNDGKTALKLALEHGRKEIAELLRKHRRKSREK